MSRKVILLTCVLSIAGLGMGSTWEAGSSTPMIGNASTILRQWGTDTPQPDTIRYDDTSPTTYYAHGGVYYLSVRFTPLQPFDLHAAYIGIYAANSTAPYNVWVTGDNGGYADPNQILELVPNLVPHTGWNQVDFLMGHHFLANQDFHIVYGPMQATLPLPGPGTYPLLDSSVDSLHRSYISETWPTNPPIDEFLGYDWRLRAGGVYASIGNCELGQQISPNISIGVQVDYYADGTIIPYCFGSNHPPGPNYPVSAVYLAIANNYQDCYLVYISVCRDDYDNPIPGHTGQVYRVVHLDFLPSYAMGLAYDHRSGTFWCADWNAQIIYHFADDFGPGGSRTLEMFGMFPAAYFGLSEMAITGLEMDYRGQSLWAVTMGSPLFPDCWLEFDISNPELPSLIQGPIPIIWQSGGGGGGGAAGLEYSEMLDQLVAINQSTNCAEEFHDVGIGAPTPLSACNLSYNGQSFGPAVMDGPGVFASDSTFASGHLYTIDSWWQGIGPFPMNEGPPPEPKCADAPTWHCMEVNEGKGGYDSLGVVWGGHYEWYRGPKVCQNLYHCNIIKIKNKEIGVEMLPTSTGVEKWLGSTNPDSAQQKWHLCGNDWDRRSRQGNFVISSIDQIQGGIELYESSMLYHEHVGAKGSSAKGYPITLATGNSFNRFQCLNDTITGITRFSNHPLSVGPLVTRALVGADTITEYSVPSGEVLSFNSTGTTSNPPLAMFLPTFNSKVAPGFPGDTVSASFVVVNAGSGSATISLIPFSNLGWSVVSYPANITLGAGEYDTVTVLIQIPPLVQDYDADFFILKAVFSSDTVGIGVVVPSIPPLDVTIEAIASDVRLRWRSSNNPADSLYTQKIYRVYRSAEPSEGFYSVAVTPDTTWTDYGILPGNGKLFYRVTAGYSE
jgi:hypothetical protein